MQIKDIKFNLKTALIIGFILTIFSRCEVKAVASSDYISLESSYDTVQRDIPFYNNILNNYYGKSDIDISTFTNMTSTKLSQLQNGNNKVAIIPCPDNKVWIRIANQTTDLKMYYYDNKYTLTGTWSTGLDIDNKAVISIDQYANNMTLASIEDKPNLTTEEFESTDYQKYLLYDYLLYYHGEIKSSSQSGGVRLNYYQERNKLDYWEWTDDNLNNNYLSGDIELFEDYFEIRDFETNISNYSMYLLRYGVIYDQYGGYRVSSAYDWEEISKPSQGLLSTWQITNLFNNMSGDRIYAIGIGTPQTPDLIRSEWFDSDYNISDFMNSNSFRLRYYVEDLPNFFLEKDVSGGGNLGQITNPSGDVTGNINLGDIVGSGDTMAGSITLEDITSKIDFNIINNPYTELWDTIVNGFKTALTSRNPKSISFNVRETEVVIHSDDIMLPQNEIKVFISLFTNTAMLMAIFIQIQKIIIKAQEGDISSLLSVTDEDIHFYNDMQMM